MDNIVIIIFIALCAFLSFICCIKIVEIEKDIEKFSNRVAERDEAIARAFNLIKDRITHTREDFTEQLDDAKHDIYHKVESLFDERISANEELLGAYFSHLDKEMEKFDLKTHQIKCEIINWFEKEIIELEKVKLTKKADTFKNLKAAFSVNGKLDKDD